MKRIVILAVSLFLVGCSPLNMENYEQLKVGMDYQEVTAIIGSPESCSEKLATRSCIWGDEKSAYIKASFIKESAILFSHKGLK